MTTEQWVQEALSNPRGVMDIGQINGATRKVLNQLVRQGKLVRTKESFCNIGRPKTVWKGAHSCH